jgi:hypothetical protein
MDIDLDTLSPLLTGEEGDPLIPLLTGEEGDPLIPPLTGEEGDPLDPPLTGQAQGAAPTNYQFSTNHAFWKRQENRRKNFSI